MGWQPRCERPSDLIAPFRYDRTGAGPSRDELRGRYFRRVSHGYYVPIEADEEIVEQRILEQSVRLTHAGAVTGWASLRWRGAAYFDGRDRHDRPLPIPLVVGIAKLRAHPGVTITQEQLAPHERELVADVWCTVPVRAVFDEIRAVRRPRSAVLRADMAMAAGLLTQRELVEYVGHRQAWTGVPWARSVVALTSDESRSPQESWMRLCWQLDAELPAPVCNHAVYDRSGHLLGVPDLFDPVAGVVGEYAGAHHRDPAQRRDDIEREERFRDHGLEYFEVVEGELPNRWTVAARMRQVRSRARFLPDDQRSWVLGEHRAA